MRRASGQAPSLRYWLVGVVALVLFFALPATGQVYVVIDATVYISLAILALSLGLVWGYGGILCFGQAAFFGLGGYAYAIAGLNFGESTGAVLLAVAVPALFAAALGYFLFYGRVSDVYFAVITLAVTLILFKLLNSTAGPEYRIGTARLGGFNGIPGTPPLNVPGNAQAILTPEQTFQVALATLLGLYYACAWLLRTHFGRVVTSIRENELRAELLGYDVRAYKLGIFAIGGGVAGLAGVFFANSVFNVTPAMFSLVSSAQVIIFVVVGGLGTLLGPIVGAVALQILTAELGRGASVDTNLVLGAVLIAFVLLLPRGIVPMVERGWQRFRNGRRGAAGGRGDGARRYRSRASRAGSDE